MINKKSKNESKERNFFGSYLNELSEQLMESAKEDYKKLSDIDKEQVINTTNKFMDLIGNRFGIDTTNYHVSDDILSSCKEKIDKATATATATCKETYDKVSSIASNSISRQEAVDMINDAIKSTLGNFGIKDVDKYTINDDDDNVYINIAKPEIGSGIKITCATDKKSGCFNEDCDTCDGKCKNPDCDVEGCDCKEETYSEFDDEIEEDVENPETDADNGKDAPSVSRVKLNLATKHIKNSSSNYNDETQYSKLAPEMVEPAKTVRKEYSANGDLVEGANPYNTGKKYTPTNNDIKARLIHEAKHNGEAESKNTIKAFKESLVSKVTSILEDSSTHNYTVYPKSEKAPAAVEVVLEDVNSFVKGNIYVLNEIEATLKELYDFPTVHITITDTDNPDFVNLVIFMVLE